MAEFAVLLLKPATAQPPEKIVQRRKYRLGTIRMAIVAAAGHPGRARDFPVDVADKCENVPTESGHRMMKIQKTTVSIGAGVLEQAPTS
jgi:hypothetical protein